MKNPSFEQNYKKLEGLVDTLEKDMPLEKAIETYEKGMKLIQSCEKQLGELKARVTVLTKKNKWPLTFKNI